MSGGEKGAVMRWVGCTSRQSEEEAGFEMAVLQKKICVFPGEGFKGSEGSKCLLAPHTSGLRDVPRCGALSLLQKDAALQGGIQQKPL